MDSVVRGILGSGPDQVLLLNMAFTEKHPMNGKEQGSTLRSFLELCGDRNGRIAFVWVVPKSLFDRFNYQRMPDIVKDSIDQYVLQFDIGHYPMWDRLSTSSEE